MMTVTVCCDKSFILVQFNHLSLWLIKYNNATIKIMLMISNKQTNGSAHAGLCRG